MTPPHPLSSPFLPPPPSSVFLQGSTCGHFTMPHFRRTTNPGGSTSRIGGVFTTRGPRALPDVRDLDGGDGWVLDPPPETPNREGEPRPVRLGFIAALSRSRGAERPNQVLDFLLPLASGVTSIQRARGRSTGAFVVGMWPRLGLCLGLKSVGGLGAVGLSLGLGAAKGLEGGQGVGVRYTPFDHSVFFPPTIPGPPPPRGGSFFQCRHFSGLPTPLVLPPPPRGTSRQPTRTLRGLRGPLALLPSRATTLFSPLAPGAETAQQAPERKGSGLGRRLRRRRNRLGLVGATECFRVGRELEAGRGWVLGLGPGLGLSFFSLRCSDVSPSFFPGTPPPRGGLSFSEHQTRQAYGQAFSALASLGLCAGSLAAVHHLEPVPLSTSTPRGGQVPPLREEFRTCPLATLPCSPPSLTLSPLSSGPPLLFYFPHFQTPQWRQAANHAGGFVSLIAPPPPPPSSSPPSAFGPPPPPEGVLCFGTVFAPGYRP